jgi:signal transduction histidine kinase
MVFEFALENGKFKTKTEATIAAVSPSLPVQAISPWPEIFRTGKPSVLEDIREGPEFPWRARVLAQGIVTILVVPMMIAGKVKGVIGVRFAQKRAFRAEELELAQALANQAMLAIQLARLSAQNRQSAIIEERNRMARDIHDTLAQGFTGVILHLEAAEEAMARERMDIVSGHLHGAGEIARDGLREARRSVQALRPLALEEKKLAEALEDLLTKQTAGTALQAKFTLQGEPRELPPEWEANILRIGQEVLTNVFRHARATEFSAVLIFSDREICLSMHDNGCGFDSAGKYSGFGLQGIAERTEDMEGQLTIQSAGGRGTTISVAVPMLAFTEQENHESFN